MKKNYFIEYIWLDGNNPQQLRSKTKIINAEESIDKIELFNWNFDGSSTQQAETSNSELVLKPVNKFKDPFRENGLLVICEVYNTDDTPHITNKRSKLVETLRDTNNKTLYGFEQEYIIYDNKTNKPLGWPVEGYPRPQGDYYCGVGGDCVSGRDFVYEHANLCIKAGLSFTGINAEVMLGQWEYQIGPVKPLDGSDQLWISRFILERLSEKYNYKIELHPKPFIGDEWNGSGMHVNFSTNDMRKDLKNKKKLVIDACKQLSENIEEHIKVYGVDNHLRLTGSNETCSINDFKWGIGDRTASIRIPYSINDDSTPGYFEDRRPASNSNPYEICDVMIKTVCKKIMETH
jgi:glutamine synthetase